MKEIVEPKLNRYEYCEHRERMHNWASELSSSERKIKKTVLVVKGIHKGTFRIQFTTNTVILTFLSEVNSSCIFLISVVMVISKKSELDILYFIFWYLYLITKYSKFHFFDIFKHTFQFLLINYRSHEYIYFKLFTILWNLQRFSFNISGPRDCKNTDTEKKYGILSSAEYISYKGYNNCLSPH